MGTINKILMQNRIQRTMVSRMLNLRIIPLVLLVGLIGCRSIDSPNLSKTAKPVPAVSETDNSPVPDLIPKTAKTVSATAPSAEPSIQQASYQEADHDDAPLIRPALETDQGSFSALPDQSTMLELPIDLPTALQLAGADHLQIQLARERIREACARLQQAEVLWIPSINFGIGYNHHDGQIQETTGNVIDVRRQSLYYGGGPGLGNAPLSGGASGPARLFVDLSLSDILFEPLAARQLVNAQQHAQQRAENDTLLQVGLLYQELTRANLQLTIAEEAIANATKLVQLTTDFEAAGEGLVADVQRSKAELQLRRRERSLAAERMAVTSAELVRLLRLDASTQLIPAEQVPLPVAMIGEDQPIELLVTEALNSRPELCEHKAKVAETRTRIEQEHWRPWLPHLFAGYSAAGFGGGPDSDLQNFGYRGDLDVLAVWQVRNLGAGNRALVRERSSQHRQAHLEFEWIRDQVIAEVAQAYSRSNYRREQIGHAELQVAAAADALPLNLAGIRDGVIRPIEAQQAIAALASARSLYVASIIDFNQAQLELIRAIGQQSY